MTSEQHNQNGDPLVRVLIVDDDDLTLKLLDRVIRRMNLPRFSTRSSIEALAYFKDHHEHLDLVISDIVMPEMTGVELSRRIRSINAKQTILLVSGYPAHEYEEVIQLNDVAFLAKPFPPQTLVDTVEQLLKGAKAPSS